MVAVPADMPVTIPVLRPTVAIVVELLVQVPPMDGSLNVVVAPMHIVAIPVIGGGGEVTVTVVVVAQPVLSSV